MHFSRVWSIRARVTPLVVVLLLARVGLANESRFQNVTVDAPCATHQLWLVSTRGASSCPRLDQISRLQYWRCDPDHQWRNSNVGELLGTDDPATTTLIHVHENRVSKAESFRRASKVFQQLSKVAPPGERFRLIAVSWPSDRIGHRQRPDVQTKAQRSEAHGLYLAWLLDQIHPDVPVTLFGYSFGPRMITASLHFLAGGSIQGQCLPRPAHRARRPVRAVLMSRGIGRSLVVSRTASRSGLNAG